MYSIYTQVADSVYQNKIANTTTTTKEILHNYFQTDFWIVFYFILGDMQLKPGIKTINKKKRGKSLC